MLLISLFSHIGSCSLGPTFADMDLADDFVKTVSIISEFDGSERFARATFDTGSDHNWVSEAYIVQRLRLKATPISKARQMVYKSLDGHDIVPVGSVRLTWYITGRANGRRTFHHCFFVLGGSDHEFDIIVGRRTIFDEGLLVWNIAVSWPEFRGQKIAEIWPERKHRTLLQLLSRSKS
jgi:hypothetical protein